MRPELEEALRRVRAGAARALAISAEDLAARSALDAPILTGFLRSTASPGPGEGEMLVRDLGDRLEIDVTFSGPYAAAQHEGKAIMHRGTKTYLWVARDWPRGGGPKYLEKNLLAMAPRYAAVVAAEVRKELEGG